MSNFFGIALAENEVYELDVIGVLRISRVAIDQGDASKLYLTVGMEKFLVATLNRRNRQMTLDLHFNKGDHFKFENCGNGNVSILGYIEPDPSTMPYEIKSDSSDDERPVYSPTGSYSNSGSSSEQNDDMPMERGYGCDYGDEERNYNERNDNEQNDNAREEDDADQRESADEQYSDDDV